MSSKLNVRAYLGQLLPVVMTQLLIRLFHATDLRLVGGLGEALRLTHAVQYNFTVLGQYIGLAGMTTVITLWPRASAGKERGELLRRVVGRTLGLCALALVAIVSCRAWLLDSFGIAAEARSVAGWYLAVGAVNMALLAWQFCLDGALLAERRQIITMINTAILMSGNLLTDLAAVRAYQWGWLSLKGAALLFVSGTTLWFLIGIAISYAILGRRVPLLSGGGTERLPLAGVWGHEVAISMVRSAAPLWFAFQIGSIKALGSFLVTYQAALHLAYVAALPLQGGLPIAVRECSAELAGSAPPSRRWLSEVVSLALLPSVLLYLAAMACGKPIIQAVFNLRLSPEHAAFLPFFFFGCIIGQIGHVVSVPLRASLQNKYITACLVASELLMNNLGVLLLTRLGLAEPWRLGALTIGYASVFLVLMAAALRRVQRKPAAVPRTDRLAQKLITEG